MKLKSLGANRTEITLPDYDGATNRRVLYSYETPVAYAETGATGRYFYRTAQFYSRTTTRHINQWLPKDQAVEQPQSFFDGLVS